MARWDGPTLTLHDATQGVSGASTAVAAVFGIAPDHVRVISPFLGGGFGCKASWSHVSLCAMAAKQVGRPVRLALTRPQMFGPVGGRPFTEQRIVLAARHKDGTLTAMRHDTIATTSTFEDWMEMCGMPSRIMYAVPNHATTHRIVALNVGTPTFMRAPGEASAVRARIGDGRFRVATRHGRSRCGSRITRRSIRRTASRGRATSCANATESARGASAGRAAPARRARCATATR